MAEPWGDDEGIWTRASDVSLASLMAPVVPVRRRTAAAASGRGEPAQEAPPVLSSSSAARTAAAHTSPRPTEALVQEYRTYLTNHCTIMTPLVYFLIMNRTWFAAKVHGSVAALDAAEGSLAALQSVSWAFFVCMVVAAVALGLRSPDVRRLTGGTPSDTLLTVIITVDALHASLNATSMLQYIMHPTTECPAARSMAACILRSYWPTTHLAFVCKWAASGLPPQVVFAPEVFRMLTFAGGATAAVWMHDGRAAALAPSFLAAVAARALAGFALSMLLVTLLLSASFDARAALPPSVLRTTCPRPLRHAQNATCAAAAAAAAALRALAFPPAGQLAWDVAARSVYPGSVGTPPPGVAALSVVVTILNNDVTLTAVGRMQTTLFWVSIALSLLTAPRPERRTLPLPAGSAVSGDGSSDDPSPQLAWADVETGDLLGQGSFAAVYAARWRGSDVALKCFLAVDEAAAGDEPAEARALAEAQLLIALRHPNVLHVYGLLPRPRALVMERGACTLQQLLRAQGATLRWRRRCELARGIAAGVEFLHAHTPPVIHGDLSCSNILLATSADDAPPKLADFGTSFVSRAGAAAALHACCAEYAAPEVVRRLAVALPQAVDAFAFGVVVHRIATARGEDVDDVKQAQGNRAAVSPGLLAAMRRVYAAELAGFQPAVREGAVPPPLARLVSACCAVAPQARPAFAQLRPELEAAMGEADEWPPPVAEGRWD